MRTLYRYCSCALQRPTSKFVKAVAGEATQGLCRDGHDDGAAGQASVETATGGGLTATRPTDDRSGGRNDGADEGSADGEGGDDALRTTDGAQAQGTLGGALGRRSRGSPDAVKRRPEESSGTVKVRRSKGPPAVRRSKGQPAEATKETEKEEA